MKQTRKKHSPVIAGGQFGEGLHCPALPTDWAAQLRVKDQAPRCTLELMALIDQQYLKTPF